MHGKSVRHECDMEAQNPPVVPAGSGNHGFEGRPVSIGLAPDAAASASSSGLPIQLEREAGQIGYGRPLGHLERGQA